MRCFSALCNQWTCRRYFLWSNTPLEMRTIILHSTRIPMGTNSGKKSSEYSQEKPGAGNVHLSNSDSIVITTIYAPINFLNPLLRIPFIHPCVCMFYLNRIHVCTYWQFVASHKRHIYCTRVVLLGDTFDFSRLTRFWFIILFVCMRAFEHWFFIDPQWGMNILNMLLCYTIVAL